MRSSVPSLSRLARVAALSLGTTLAAALPAAAQANGSPGDRREDRPAACTDFYAHVNHDWLQRTPLPADRARVGSFDELGRANTERLTRALNGLLADPKQQDTPGLRLLAAWYGSGLDPAHAQAAGLKPVQPLMTQIAQLQKREDLPALWAAFARHRLGAPLSLWVGPDNRDVRRNIAMVSADGLGLPDRDDYLKTDATSTRLQTAYRQHAATLLKLAGAPHDAATIDALMALETEMARAMLTTVERRDPQVTNHRRTLRALQAEAPGLDWAVWMQAVGVGPERLPANAEFMLGQPKHAQAVARLAAEAPLAAWQAYFRVRLLDSLAPWLTQDFRDSHFAYRGRVLRGVQAPAPRHEELIELIGGRTGFEPLAQTLGELFVREAFSPQAQARANRMIEDVRVAMRQRIDGLEWMSPATKVRAQEKLAAMTAQVGGPERWPDYGPLTLDPKDPVGNALKAQAWGHEQRLADLGQPVDRSRWTTSPHIVNAFAAGLNRIVFPAGILQPPFFDANADDASNYGGIGMVIGHEIIHHFDDRGRQYDAVGNLADWWTAEDAAAYRARADRVAAFYSRYEPLPGLRINGRQMLGENISDLGGMNIALDALNLALKREPASRLNGQTPQQRFFTANAVIWRGKQRPEALEQQIRTGQHSPGPFRVRGPMSVMPAFAQAFSCQAGDPMVAPDPVAVW